MPSLRIKVGASLDSSVATAFTSIERAAAHAATTIQSKLGGAMGTASKRLAAGAEQAATATGRATRKTTESLGAVADGAAARFRVLSTEMRKLPADLSMVAREAQRALQQIEREKARKALGLPGGGPPAAAGGGWGGVGKQNRYWYSPSGNWNIRKPTMPTLVSDPIHGIARFGMGAAGFMSRAALGMARNMGVETSFGSLVGQNLREEDVAQDISSAGYFPGQGGPNGQLVNRSTLLSESRQTAISTGQTRGDILEGLREFVGKTGDLDLARSVIADMAKLSAATGAHLGDMASASAEVSNVLGDVPNKAKVIKNIMQQVAGQGKMGAVEIRDLATQMAKLAANAGKFEGGAEKNIGTLGILAQEAKLRGGATNAATATTGVARFVDFLTTKARVKGLKKVGIDPFTDKSETVLRDPTQIIKELLSKTHGNLEQMSGLVPNVMAMRPVLGLASIYNATKASKEQRQAAFAAAHGGSMKGYSDAAGLDAAKIAAVNEELDHMRAAMLTDQEVNRAFAEKMGDSRSKVTVFNEKMAAAAERIAGAVIPAFEQLTPHIISAAEGLANLAVKLANWGTASGVGAGAPAQEIASAGERRLALTNQLREALAAPVGSGPYKLAKDTSTGQWVGTHGAIDRGAYEALQKDPQSMEAQIQAKQKDIDARSRETLHEQQVLRDAHGWDPGGIRAGKIAKNAEAVNFDKQDIANLREQQARTVQVLQDIHTALTTGQVTFKPEAQPVPPPVSPAGVMSPEAQ